MTDLEGRPTWTSRQVVTTNGALHDQVLEQLAGG
jgi:hypothetical protein